MIIEPVQCLLCLRRWAAEGFRTCERCGEDVRDALDDIVRLYPLAVDDALGPTSTASARSSSTYRSMPPLDLDRLDKTERLAAEDVVGTLASWAAQVRTLTGQPARRERPTVSSEVAALVRMWPWIRKQELIGDLARDVLQMRATLSRLAREGHGHIPIGPCPITTPDPQTGTPRRCGQLLHARRGERTVRCPRCGTPWPRLHWPDLGAALRAADTT